MKLPNSFSLSMWAGFTAAIIGLITFLLHWIFWEMRGGPLAGYNLLLGPGNFTLTHIWHPLFTEELPLIPKVALMLIGQFTLVSIIVAIVRPLINFIVKAVTHN